jgi:hypothetical protein
VAKEIGICSTTFCKYLNTFIISSSCKLKYYHKNSSIKEVPISEALAFNPKWKIPSVVYYQRVHLSESLNSFPILPTVTIDVFRELSKAKESGKNKNKPLTYTPLGPDEIPQKGELVAIDAEFVTLGQEETELRSDGKLATVKPQQLSLGKNSKPIPIHEFHFKYGENCSKSNLSSWSRPLRRNPLP